MRLDSHQHFWNYSAAEYPWITDKLAKIRRSFGPAELAPHLKAANLDGCIAVQARQTIQESDWLLSLAEQSPIIKGVVGWVDLRADDVERDLERLAKRPKFIGVRHVAQDEPDDRFHVRGDVLRGIGKLKQFGLAYDILIFPKQLPAAIELVNRSPEQRFILDHIAKPNIRERQIEPWRAQIQELAKAPNVFCKISGLVTEAIWESWKESDIRPYLDIVAEAFTPARLLYGSDWPVCLLAAEYEQVFGIVENWAQQFSPAERAGIFGGVCAQAYKLSLS